MTIRAVLFDLDGTVLAAGRPTSDPVEAASSALAAFGVSAPAETLLPALQAAIPPYVPGEIAVVEPFGRSLGLALRSLGIDAPETGLEAATRAMYGTLVAHDRVFDDARALLASLRYRGFATAVVTNANFPGSLVREHLADLGIAAYFDAAVSSSDAGFGKPHPAPFARALALLGIPVGEALFIGDREETDIVGAHAAGLTAVRIDRDHAGGPTLAVATISRLTELVALIGEGEPGSPRGDRSGILG